jgi:large subunit ribosomal protein L18
MRPGKKRELSQRRHWRVRQKVTGTLGRPRMSVKFTSENIYVQFIDDEAGHTLAAVSTLNNPVPEGESLAANAANAAGAKRLGKIAAEAAKARGIEHVVFDRGGARYHGKVKALADAARESGLKF